VVGWWLGRWAATNVVDCAQPFGLGLMGVGEKLGLKGGYCSKGAIADEGRAREFYPLWGGNWDW